jgi:hypothetical protein
LAADELAGVDLAGVDLARVDDAGHQRPGGDNLGGHGDVAVGVGDDLGIGRVRTADEDTPEPRAHVARARAVVPDPGIELRGCLDGEELR